MRGQTETPDYDAVEYPELPNGWEWFSGNVSSGYYTRWFGTEYRKGGDLIGVEGSIGGFEGEMYWDEGNRHTVAIYPIVGIRDDGDPELAALACKTRQFDSMQDAIDAIPEMIAELKSAAKDDDE